MKESLLKTVTQGNVYGEPLIAFHGWAMNSSVWEAVKTELETDYLVTWVDLPGHGINKSVTATSLQQVVTLMLPLIKTKSHLMGWSLGGLVVQALAQQIPNKILSLNLITTSPRFSQAENWPFAMGREQLDYFSKNVQKDPEATIKRFIALQFLGIKNTKQLQRDLIRNVINTPASNKALTTGLTILSTADFRHVKHTVPQHWIMAECDRLIPKSVINDLKLIYPDAQITLLENMGHAPFMTHPNEFMVSFKHFMKKLEPPAKC